MNKVNIHEKIWDVYMKSYLWPYTDGLGDHRTWWLAAMGMRETLSIKGRLDE